MWSLCQWFFWIIIAWSKCARLFVQSSQRLSPLQICTPLCDLALSLTLNFQKLSGSNIATNLPTYLRTSLTILPIIVQTKQLLGLSPQKLSTKNLKWSSLRYYASKPHASRHAPSKASVPQDFSDETIQMLNIMSCQYIWQSRFRVWKYWHLKLKVVP